MDESILVIGVSGECFLFYCILHRNSCKQCRPWSDTTFDMDCTWTALTAYNQARGYKTFSMLNSDKHEILNAHKYENIKKFSFFLCHVSLE